MNYYDIDDILAEEEAIKCIFRVPVIGMGKLDEHSCDDDLKEGTVLELPYWLSCALVERNMIELDLPRYFSDRFRRNLLVDPPEVNLNDRTPYFYELGRKISKLVQDVDLSDVLQKTLAARYDEILKRSTRFRLTDTSTFEDRLTNIERRLYNTRSKSDNNYILWKNRLSGRISTNNNTSSSSNNNNNKSSTKS